MRIIGRSNKDITRNCFHIWAYQYSFLSYFPNLILGRCSAGFVLRRAFLLLMTSLVWTSSRPKEVIHEILFVEIIISFVLLQKDAEYAWRQCVSCLFCSNQCMTYFLKLLFFNLTFRVHFISVLDGNEIFAKNLCFADIFSWNHIYGTYLAAWQEKNRSWISSFPKEFVCTMWILKITAEISCHIIFCERISCFNAES